MNNVSRWIYKLIFFWSFSFLILSKLYSYAYNLQQLSLSCIGYCKNHLSQVIKCYGSRLQNVYVSANFFFKSSSNFFCNSCCNISIYILINFLICIFKIVLTTFKFNFAFLTFFIIMSIFAFSFICILWISSERLSTRFDTPLFTVNPLFIGGVRFLKNHRQEHRGIKISF